MIADWLAREGWIILSWWLLASLAGAAALPLTFSLLRNLPDRGYTLARALGLLLTGFIFWLGTSLGLMINTPGSMVLAWLILAGCGAVLYLRRAHNRDWRGWWHANRRFILLAELLFIAALLALALLRAYNNSLHGTEKPMELAFLSATQRSASFPPADPWLAGHAISYYYFGYVLMAMLANLSGIGSTLAFNMSIALLFALGALTAYGVAGNLARTRPGRTGLPGGLLGACFVVLLGNWQLPLIELPWQSGLGRDAWFAFWGQHERLTAKVLPLGEQVAGGLADWDFWWWFRASRVLTDINLDGSQAFFQPISEFPAFSFLLADVHPHVLALPFALLTIGLALQLALQARAPDRVQLLLCGLVGGGMLFLNAWDGPVYLLLLVSAEGLRRLLRSERGRLHLTDLLATAWLGLRLVLLALLCYLPFYVGFRTQAGGFLPNLQHPSSLRQLFLIFAPFALILGAWLLLEGSRVGPALNRRLLLRVTVGGPLLLLLLVLVLALASALLQGETTLLQDFVRQSGDPSQVVQRIGERRLEGLPGLLALCGGVGLALARLFPRLRSAQPSTVARVDAGTGFALLLTASGLLLVLAPEFVFLRDVFNARSNTIFKLYYQAWLLFSVAAAWAVDSFFAEEQGKERRRALGALTVCAILPGLLYPLAGVYTRAFVETGRLVAAQPAPLSLDGGPGFINADDYAAIRCLEAHAGAAQPVVAEAPGSSYDGNFGRVGTLTGMPVLLNWEGHQRQWRGSSWEMLRGSRADDLDSLFRSPDMQQTREVLERYDVEYVFYGSSEMMKYGMAGERKFRDSFDSLCEFGDSRFYRVASLSGTGPGDSRP